MNVIMLDIDGVLNHGHREGSGFDWIHPPAVEALNTLTRRLVY